LPVTKDTFNYKAGSMKKINHRKSSGELLQLERRPQETKRLGGEEEPSVLKCSDGGGEATGFGGIKLKSSGHVGEGR